MSAKLNFLLVLTMMVLFGCQTPELEDPVIEDLGMVGVIGFDYVDDEDVKVTVTLPQPNQDAQEAYQKFTTVVKMPHQAIMDMSTLSEKVLTFAQLRVVLFSEEYARKIGVWKVLENLYRDPRVGTNVYIAIVKGNVEEILGGDYKDKPEINIYLHELLTPRPMMAFSPITTLHYFINRKTDEVSEPSVPYLEKVDERSIKITKTAIFKSDKLVDTIDPEEAKLFEGLKKKKVLPDIAIMLPGEKTAKQEEAMVILKFVENRFHSKVNGDLENPEIYVHLYVRGSIVDYGGQRNLDSVKERKEIEQKIGKQLEDKVIKIMKNFQDIGIDPAGIGEQFRLQNSKEWSKEKWNEAFKNAKITVHVEARIISSGTIR
ncbi:Ger(x)C family spore germination protein [Bacillus solitudinis]|uniref:Ger(x)C family spore germination protein n=1 Tax=Bacillus solitudinis TaxID=2014074 RepID=UPI0012FD270D|nr:Ger(x)C family spore germination protein [Bacillus solitudinis]